MTGFQKKWVVPALIVTGMFALGVLAGAAVGMIAVKPKPPAKAEKTPWEDTRVPRLAEGGPAAPEGAAALKAGGKRMPVAKAAAGNEPDAEKAAPLSSFPAGPVKRALEASLDRLKPVAAKCFEEEKAGFKSREVKLSFRFELEAVGGMATVSLAEVRNPSPAAAALQACLVRKIGTLLIDFPAEDGSYAFLAELTLSSNP